MKKGNYNNILHTNNNKKPKPKKNVQEIPQRTAPVNNLKFLTSNKHNPSKLKPHNSSVPKNTTSNNNLS